MNRLTNIVLKNILRVPGIMAKLNRYAKNADAYPEPERWAYLQKVLSLVRDSANVELVVTGLENIPTQSGFMLYANHQGMFDVVALGSTCPQPLGIVYKKEIRSVPILKQIYACTKSFAMDREDVRQSLTVINAVTEEVKQGRNYIIFPEGTRSRNGNVMGAFHGGSFRCAAKSKCPIVPVALVDCYPVFDKKGCDRLTAQIHYLPVIPYEEYKVLKPAQIAELVKARIQSAIDANTQP